MRRSITETRIKAVSRREQAMQLEGGSDAIRVRHPRRRRLNDDTRSGLPTTSWWAVLPRALGRFLRLGYFLFGVAGILSLSYLFGHGQLEGILFGNDIPWALSLAQWYDRWFPDLAIWFPLQGGGTPLLFLYPPGTSLLVVLLSRLTGLTVIQAFRLLGFLSVPITGVGIYMLVWAKLKSQTAALVAGLFLPLSTATWHWLVTIGLYAQSVSIMILENTCC